MTKEILLTKVGNLIKKSDELSVLKGENFNVFQIFDMERDENKMHSRFIETLLNPKGNHGMKSVFLNLFLETINQTDYFKKKEHVYTKVEHFIGKVDYSKGDKSTGGRIDIYIWGNKKSISIENKIYASDQQNQIIRYNNHNKEFNKVFYLTLNGNSPTKESKGKLIDDCDNNENSENPDFYCISYSETIIEWLEKCQKEAADYPIIRESIKQYIITIKRLTGQLIDQKMEQDIIDLIKKNYSESRIITDNIVKAKKLIIKEFLENLNEKIIDKIEKDKLSKNWITDLEDIADSTEYRKLWIFREDAKNRQLSIVLEVQPKFWKNPTILGLHSGLIEITSEEKNKIEDYLSNYSFRNEYPKSYGSWLMYRQIFNFGVEEEFLKYIQDPKEFIDNVSEEIIIFAKHIEKYFE